MSEAGDNVASPSRHDATGVIEWLPVKEAASRRGVSERTIQRQATKGDLPSRMEGKRLFVCISGNTDATNGGTVATGDTPESVSRQPEMSRHVAENGHSVATEALIGALQSEVAFLRETVKAHQQSESELRRLMSADRQELLELRQRLAITAGARRASPDLLSPQETEPPQRAWWQVWKGKG